MTGEQHTAIGNIMFHKGTDQGCIGVLPNPWADQCKEWDRRKKFADVRRLCTEKIEMLFEPRFITPPETSELIESIVTATGSTNILEIGMYSGFTSLHVIRAIAGKGKLTSIDARPAHDREFFARPEITEHFKFIQGWTPEVLKELHGQFFDLVFIDSDHTVEHTEKEKQALLPITKPGSIWLFHDVPEWCSPEDRRLHPVRQWLYDQIGNGFFYGHPIPTCEQLDCLQTYGAGYPKQINPHVGFYIRRH